MPETRWEWVLQGIAYAVVVVFIVLVGIQLVQNVTASPYDKVVQFEESHDHLSTD